MFRRNAAVLCSCLFAYSMVAWSTGAFAQESPRPSAALQAIKQAPCELVRPSLHIGGGMQRLAGTNDLGLAELDALADRMRECVHDRDDLAMNLKIIADQRQYKAAMERTARDDAERLKRAQDAEEQEARRQNAQRAAQNEALEKQLPAACPQIGPKYQKMIAMYQDQTAMAHLHALENAGEADELCQALGQMLSTIDEVKSATQACYRAIPSTGSQELMRFRENVLGMLGQLNSMEKPFAPAREKFSCQW